jgi:hypothetical protein
MLECENPLIIGAIDTIVWAKFKFSRTQENNSTGRGWEEQL